MSPLGLAKNVPLERRVAAATAATMGTLTMGAKERRLAVIMAGVQAGELNLVGAAAVLGLSYRQTKRVWRRYRAAGDAGRVHRLRRQANWDAAAEN